MLLSSPAFQDWISQQGDQDLAKFGESSDQQVKPVKSELNPQPSAKDVDPSTSGSFDAAPKEQQGTPFVGMTMIPEHPVGLTNVYDSNVDHWANNMDFSLYDQQVFAVTSLPEGPAIDQLSPSMLSEKSSVPILPIPLGESSKNDAPVIERMPCVVDITESNVPTPELDVDQSFDESDPAFALFSDSPESTSCPILSHEPILGSIQLEKAFGRVELVIEEDSADSGDLSSATVERFQLLCSTLDELSERISLVIPGR